MNATDWIVKPERAAASGAQEELLRQLRQRSCGTKRKNSSCAPERSQRKNSSLRSRAQEFFIVQ